MSATQVATGAETSPLGEGSDHDATSSRPTQPPLWRRPSDWTPQWIARLLAPAVIYLGIRELGLLVLDWMSAHNGVSSTAALTSWDGQWFLSIAADGYGGVPPWLGDAFGQRTAETPLAFFPGYPMLIRAVAVLPGLGLVAAALAVSTLAGVACAYGLHRLGTRIGGSGAVGLILVALFAASPMSIVLSMAYTEALFCALAVWTLVCTLERRWLIAGLLCAVAGLVRPTSGALVVAIWVAAVMPIVRRRDAWRPWAAVLLSPLGLASYLGWVAMRTGHLDGWFALQQRGWDSRFDGGAATLKFSLQVLASARSVLEVATVGIVLTAIVLFVIAIRNKMPLPLLAYTAVVMVMDLGANGLMNSKARLLIPAFTLLLPPAIGLAKRRRGTVVAVLWGVAVVSAWFGAYSITAWSYAI